jgi:hypothetical protein
VPARYYRMIEIQRGSNVKLLFFNWDVLPTQPLHSA